MSTVIKIRRDTAAAWTTANPVLASGEQALETDTGKTKIGTGATAWKVLPYEVGRDALKAVKDVADAAYPKPTAGIPLADLAPEVRTALASGGGGSAAQFVSTDPDDPTVLLIDLTDGSPFSLDPTDSTVLVINL